MRYYISISRKKTDSVSSTLEKPTKESIIPSSTFLLFRSLWVLFILLLTRALSTVFFFNSILFCCNFDSLKKYSFLKLPLILSEKKVFEFRYQLLLLEEWRSSLSFFNLTFDYNWQSEIGSKIFIFFYQFWSKPYQILSIRFFMCSLCVCNYKRTCFFFAKMDAEQ